MTDQFLTRIEAAKYLGVTPETLAVWASNGDKKLPYYRFARKAMYKMDDLNAYIKSTMKG